jgi:hypothetical protein
MDSAQGCAHTFTRGLGMKIRRQLASVVREMSVVSDLPVDTILEEAVMMWVEVRSPSFMKKVDGMRAQSASREMVSPQDTRLIG